MSTVAPINPFTSTTPSQPTTKTLTQDDFLKVMIAQLKQQDPSNAQDSSKFMDQFMTMGNFQAMQSMETNMGSMYNQQQAMFANDLVGKNVEVHDEANNVDITGTVQSSRVTDQGILMTINNHEYPVADLLRINQPQTPSA